jgi:hypothetical protein
LSDHGWPVKVSTGRCPQAGIVVWI